MPRHVNSPDTVMELSKTFDTAWPERSRLMSSWLECPNCEVIVVFGSSISKVIE